MNVMNAKNDNKSILRWDDAKIKDILEPSWQSKITYFLKNRVPHYLEWISLQFKQTNKYLLRNLEYKRIVNKTWSDLGLFANFPENMILSLSIFSIY